MQQQKQKSEEKVDRLSNIEEWFVVKNNNNHNASHSLATQLDLNNYTNNGSMIGTIQYESSWNL